MADDVTAHNGAPGDGTAVVVATDEITSGVHTGAQAQVMKLAYGGDGIGTHIGADVRGLDVDVTRLPRGSKTFFLVAPTTTATAVVAANSERKAAFIQNTGAVTVRLGASGVTFAGAGVTLGPGEVLIDGDSTDAWYAITSSGTAALSGYEVA